MKNIYRACAEINLDVLEHNIREIKSVIGDETDLMCVLKTNAYGHGSVAIARELEIIGVHSFAVATIEEGIELRKHGIKLPILVLGYISKDQYHDMIYYDIMPSIYNYGMLKDINSVAESMNTVANVHINIDTGMSKVGFPADDNTVRTLVMVHMLLKHIHMDGIFTHFLSTDSADHSLCAKQMLDFSAIIETLESVGIRIPHKHCATSASIIRYPNTSMNMVRPGIMLYGLYPSEVTKTIADVEPIMQLKSRVIFVKSIEAGTPVGYEAASVCDKPMKIATVSIGYGDGYPRDLSNKGRVLIGNASWPIIGRVRMDQIMVDITGSESDITEGDEVVLVGRQGSESISAEEIANLSGLFLYEFICRISRRVPRVYKRNGEVTYVTDYLQA